jgi:hypothetical protein
MRSSNLLFGDDTVAENRHSPGRDLEVPAGYVGEYVIPGSGRHVWWTGRVAIGLLYRRERHDGTGQSGVWIQDLLLARGAGGTHAR